jgi:hypothetical protein
MQVTNVVLHPELLARPFARSVSKHYLELDYNFFTPESYILSHYTDRIPLSNLKNKVSHRAHVISLRLLRVESSAQISPSMQNKTLFDSLKFVLDADCLKPV